MNALALAAALVAQTFPPALPGGQEAVTDTSPDFLKPPAPLKSGVAVAQTPPKVDFLLYPGQDYPGKPWSAWGDSTFARGKYYSAIGDHLALGGKGDDPKRSGNAFVYEYDPATKKLRRLVDVRKLLGLPEGHYTPGKIHSRIDMGEDGWLYYSTHRGSSRATTDAYHYKGDWVLRTNPATGESEILAQGPVPKHCIPTSVLDPKRLIFYGGTASGGPSDDDGVQFFAFDAQAKKVLYSGGDGPSRYMIFARSTGRVYWTPGKDDMVGPLLCWDPEKGGAPRRLETTLGLRAATGETPQGVVYSVSKGGRGGASTLWAFDTKTEKAEQIGEAPVGTHGYIASIDADPAGRYLYYVAGAHGGADQDGTPVVQFDTRTRKKKVIAFLSPFYGKKYGMTPVGTYTSAVDDTGATLYVTFNTNRGGRAWDCVGLWVIHIPEPERAP